MSRNNSQKGKKTQEIPLSSLASALHLETRLAHGLFLTRACIGRIWFLEGNELPRADLLVVRLPGDGVRGASFAGR